MDIDKIPPKDNLLNSEDSESLKSEDRVTKPDNKPSCEGTISDIPSWNKDNEYVKSGYRINIQGIRNIAWTFFQIHNETVNVWSHFLGKVLFITLGVLICFYYPNMHN